jgi:carbohydrate diacid regulator
MLNSTTSSIITQKLSTLIPKKVAIIDLKGNCLASTYPLSKTRVFEVSNDVRAIPLYYGGQTVGYAYVDEPIETIKSIANLVKSMAELLIHQINIAENITSKDQRQDKFIYDLLNSEKIDPDLFVAESKVFETDLKRPRIVLVTLINGELGKGLASDTMGLKDKEIIISRFKRGLSRGLDSFYTRLNQNVIAYFGKNMFVILKDLGDEKESGTNLDHFQSTLKTIHEILKTEIRADLTIGVGSYHSGVLGLRDSYKEAYLASQLGEELWGTNQVFNINDFGVVAPLLSGVNEKNLEFSQKMLKKISNEDEIGRTIDVFFESNMSLTRTSKILKIHRNTLVYRLDKITETLGLDPRVFEDAVQIKLALLFSQFSKESKAVVR